MSQSKKIALGILTGLPLVFFVLYLSVFFSMFSGFADFDNGAGNMEPDIFFNDFKYAFVYIGLMFLTGIALLIIYILDIVKNKNLEEKKDSRTMWILIVVFTGTIGMYIYYFLEIYPRKDASEMLS